MFDAYVRDFALWTPRAPAVVLPRRQVSYAQFDADIDRLGQALARLGLAPGSGVVSLDLRDTYLQYAVLAALARLGVTTSPYNDDRADLRLLDHDEPAGPDAPPAQRLGRDWQAAVLAAEHRPLPMLLPDPLAVGRVMLSSGTTRAPRRVALTWRRIDVGNFATLRTYCAGKVGTWIPITGVDSMMGFSMAVGAWCVGASLANALPMADMGAWLEALPPGMISLTPNHLRQLLAALPADFRPRPDWRIVVGGSMLPAAVAREARLRLTPDIRILYGSTESGMTGVGYAADVETAPGQIGVTPAGNICEIVDDEGRPLPDGESGEMRVRGPRMIWGYVGDEAATAERFRDGWFYTGDIGRRLPADHPLPGRLVVEGRADDRMNLGGVKFMPNVLEEAAAECPGVLDAAAFAAPDNKGFDQCWLAVVTQPGFDRDSLATHLARYRGLPPNRFAWTDAIPRNAMGKVERNKLRDALLAVIRAGAG